MENNEIFYHAYSPGLVRSLGSGHQKPWRLTQYSMCENPLGGMLHLCHQRIPQNLNSSTTGLERFAATIN